MEKNLDACSKSPKIQKFSFEEFHANNNFSGSLLFYSNVWSRAAAQFSLITGVRVLRTNCEESFKVGFLYSSLDSTRWPEGFTALYSAEIALEKVKDAAVLPEGVSLDLIPVATDCDTAKARDNVLRLLEENEVKLFIGPPCRIEAQDICGFLAHPLFRNTTYRKPFVVSTASTYVPLLNYEDLIIRLDIFLSKNISTFCYILTK